MFKFLLSLLPDFVKVYFGIKVDTAERLGKAEQESTDLQQDLKVSQAEAKASADSPKDKAGLIQALKDHDFSILILASLLLTSCGDKPVTSICPRIAYWPPGQQDELEATMATLPPDALLVRVGVELKNLRDQSRACQKAGG